MKFSTREDIAAPMDQVFNALSDFEAFERQAMRRGIDVRRIDPLTQPGVGMRWQVKFKLRGRKREMELELTRFDPEGEMIFDAKSPGIEAKFMVELVPLSRSRTRMSIALDMTPLNLSARLLVQSLKLAKSNLNNRFKQRAADYAKSLEERLQSTA